MHLVENRYLECSEKSDRVRQILPFGDNNNSKQKRPFKKRRFLSLKKRKLA